MFLQQDILTGGIRYRKDSCEVYTVITFWNLGIYY